MFLMKKVLRVSHLTRRHEFDRVLIDFRTVVHTL